jgi:hypothetical protein
VAKALIEQRHHAAARKILNRMLVDEMDKPDRIEIENLLARLADEPSTPSTSARLPEHNEGI